jgi:hypothetical protein
MKKKQTKLNFIMNLIIGALSLIGIGFIYNRSIFVAMIFIFLSLLIFFIFYLTFYINEYKNNKLRKGKLTINLQVFGFFLIPILLIIIIIALINIGIRSF